MSLWAEFHRRSVFRVAGVYAVVGWLLAQAAVLLEDTLALPPWFDSAIVALLLLGFPIALVLAWAFELTPEGVRRTASAKPDEPRPRLAAIDFVIVVALAVLIGVSAYQAIRPLPTAAVAGNPAQQPAPATPQSDERASIAVLAFADMSPERDQEYFSDGVSEEILNRLAPLEGLRVIARTSSFSFKGQNADVRTIGATLDVMYVLEGSVRKAGEELRVTAQLIDASNGAHVWSQTYDGRLDDVFAVQDEIAAAVAEAMSDTLGVTTPSIRAGGTDNIEAYDAYLRGRSVGPGSNDIDIPQAIELLRRAVDLDPEFGEAWVELASAYVMAGAGAPSPETQAELRAATDNARRRAVESAPDLWDTQVALGWALARQRRWVDANSAFERAYALAAEAGADTRQHGWSYPYETGRLEDALAYIETTRRVDPLSPTNDSAHDNILYALGRRAEPSASGDAPSSIMRLAHAIDVHDEDTVDALFAELAGIPIFGGLRVLRPVWGSREDALAAIRQATLGSGFRSPGELLFGAVFAAVYDDADLAVTLLRANFIDGGGDIGRSFVWFPEFREVRATEAFKMFLRDLGLVDLWRTTGAWADFCRPVGADDFECS